MASRLYVYACCSPYLSSQFVFFLYPRILSLISLIRVTKELMSPVVSLVQYCHLFLCGLSRSKVTSKISSAFFLSLLWIQSCHSVVKVAKSLQVKGKTSKPSSSLSGSLRVFMIYKFALSSLIVWEEEVFFPFHIPCDPMHAWNLEIKCHSPSVVCIRLQPFCCCKLIQQH